MNNPLSKLTPMASLTIGLFGADAVVAARILISHLGHTGKQIGLVVVADIAVADLVFLRYLRRRHPELTRKATPDQQS